MEASSLQRTDDIPFFFAYWYGGFHEWGYPQNGWMVCNGTYMPLKWMIWGCAFFVKPPYHLLNVRLFLVDLQDATDFASRLEI